MATTAPMDASSRSVTARLKPLKVDLARASNQALVELQTDPNEWYARHARRVLQERGTSAEVSGMLRKLSQTTRDQAAIQLRILWASHAVGGLSEPGAIASKLDDPDPTIRAWTIQLASEQGTPVSSILSKFAELARTDPSPLVRLYLASASQRLPLGTALGNPRRTGQPCRRRRRP